MNFIDRGRLPYKEEGKSLESARKRIGIVNDLPSIALLEDTHTFPGVYVFKVIGRTEGAFAARVVAAARQALQWDEDPPFRLRETAGGRYVAVTLEPELASAHQVLAVYNRLRSMDGLVLCL